MVLRFVLALIALLVLAFVAPRLDPLRTFWVRLARRKRLVVFLAGVATFLIGMSISALRFPSPRGHDEFSYLLAADTFSQGRLTNPTHPMWRFFQSYHVIHQPTYASKYPPAQGLMLALGKRVGGYFAVGSWLGLAVGVAAVCWMLQGWLPSRWALCGAVLLVFQNTMHLQWGQTFWGGSLAMAGGALVWGALPRIWRRGSTSAAICMGVGLVVLANSRPFEGLVASIPVAGAMGVWLVRNRARTPANLVRVVLPILAILGVGGAAMLYYNWRVTGDASKMPYQVYQEQYLSSKPHLIFDQWESRPKGDKPGPVPEDVRNADRFGARQNLLRLIEFRMGDVHYLSQFYLNFSVAPAFLLGLVGFPWLWSKRWALFAMGSVVLSLLASAVTSYPMNPHYLAPIVPALVMLLTAGLWMVSRLPRHQPRLGTLAVRVVVLYQILTFFVTIAAVVVYAEPTWNRERDAMIEELSATGQKHLVIVRYGSDHHPFNEWVYNEADIDAADVVWAHEKPRRQERVDREQLNELLEYFSDRQVWLFDESDLPWKFVDYRRATAQARRAPSAPTSDAVVSP